MKRSIFGLVLIVILGAGLPSCDLGPGENWIKSEIFVNLTSWNLPDTAKVSTPFNLTLNSFIESTCIHNLEFVVNKYNDSIYTVWAHAIYENSGEDCLVLTDYKDSTVSITLNQTGKYYYFFLNEDLFKADSIIIIP